MGQSKLPRTVEQRALIALGVVAIIWGTTWIATKTAVTYMPPLQMAGMRQVMAGLIYIAYFIFKGVSFPRGKAWIPILLLALLNFTLSNGLSTWGLRYISAGLGAIIGAIFPLWLVIIGLMRSQEKLSTKALTGLILGFGGICIIFYEHLYDFLIPDFRLGIMLSITATWAWAFGTVYTKEHALQFNPYFSIGLQMFISGTFILMVTKATGYTIPLTEIPLPAWGGMAFLVLISSVFTFIAYLYALQHLPTNLVSVYAYINPIVAVLCGWVIFDEKLTPFIVTGMLVTIFGVYMVNQAFQSRKKHVSATTPPGDLV